MFIFRIMKETKKEIEKKRTTKKKKVDVTSVHIYSEMHSISSLLLFIYTRFTSKKRSFFEQVSRVSSLYQRPIRKI